MIHFGVFEADLETGELRKRGVRIKLQEQPFQILSSIRNSDNERIGFFADRKLNADFLWCDSTPSYVITEALKVLFKRDVEFKAWLGQHANDQNSERVQGEALTKTA